MPRYILDTPRELSANNIRNIIAHASPAGRPVATLTPEAKTLHIIGRRWFQKSFGNTYHTVEVWIDGQRVHKSGKCYGYGDGYLQTAVDWLKSVALLPQTARYGTLYLREESGYTFSYECHDVSRQKDL